LGVWARFAGFVRSRRTAVFGISAAAAFLLFAGVVFLLRYSPVHGAPQTYLYLEICGALLSFCFAANALVRFRGTHDRTALILAIGFVVSGVMETVGYFGLAAQLEAGTVSPAHVPMSWMVSRTLLAVLLLAGIAVGRRMPNSRQPSREIAIALLIVAAASYLTSAAFLAAPAAPLTQASSFISRPWDLLPGLLFAVAACFYFRRLRDRASPYDYSLFGVTILNVASHFAASFSRVFFDGPFFVAEVCKTASYAVILGGALLDQARLFDHVRELAVRDPLTGLANYRRLISSLAGELERSRRSRQPFSVVLLDMDGLKTINDQYGHLVGSRALCRLATVLRAHSRSIDTPARYGGDEFALVLPEAGRAIALHVVDRIRERLGQDGELPRLSVSAGFSVFPEDGDTPEKLLAVADNALYRMKRRQTNMESFARIVACL
jgi:diguanylate cyclase (GGDEF)-like protein